MSKKQVTIQDIAKELNITASTVSRALNDHPKIKQSTKELVQNTAKKLNYQPNSIAASLRKGRATTVGMIVPRINRHFFSNVITGVESVLNPAGYNLIICQSEESIEKENENINTLIANRVGGVLISISIETKTFAHLERVLSHHIPLVMFDRIADELDVSMVENDDVSGSYDLTKHILAKGAKTIAWIGGPRSSNIYQNRYNGYKKALEEAGINPKAMTCFEGSITLDSALDFIRPFIEKNKNNMPDAIFSASDYMAMGVIQGLQEAGYKIPEDIMIAGYSNEPFAELISPKLTTVDQFSEEMGRATAKLLLEEIEAKNEYIHKKTTLKPKLIIRESTDK
ncbi:MAG: LacI family DNA-binding transcriptional regulator [Prolixibacteraceae bacterium]|nr:LacI family DNA-binding transcriptional regulator [Prolixibacteraceae bacterium]